MRLKKSFVFAIPFPESISPAIPSVVEGEVKPSKIFDRASDHGFDLFFDCYISTDKQAVAACLLNEPDRLRSLGLTPPSDDNVRTLFGKSDCRRPPDSRGPASDQCNFSDKR